jgi:tetratricopeptide (TPR) repeat protein
MSNHKNNIPLIWSAVLAFSFFQSCSSLPHFIRHKDPLSFDQHLQLGSAYEFQGLLESAGQEYDAALKIKKSSLPANMARGNLAFEAGDFKKAEGYYRHALRIDRLHSGANNNLAMVYLARGKSLKKAEKLAWVALNQGGPLRPYVLETLAEIYIRQSRFEEAQALLITAENEAEASNKILTRQISKTQGRVAEKLKEGL